MIYTRDSWNADRVQMLKKLWADGLPASEIAREMGGVTRGAIIGKVHRLGLNGRRKVRIVSAPRERTIRSVKLAQVFKDVALQEEPAFDYVIPLAQRISFLDLTEANCHWPVGDPECEDFYFCGGKSVTNLPYCATHSRMAHQSGTALKQLNLPPITFRQPTR